MDRMAHFFVGQLVHHQRFNYRGVVFDVDATFQGTEEWYAQVALSRPPQDQPWYHVLVDQAGYATYVPERHLKADTANTPITHPLLDKLFGNFSQDRYMLKETIQ